MEIMISITDLMIMTPDEIKKASKKLNLKEIDDLVSELDNEATLLWKIRKILLAQEQFIKFEVSLK